jgi:phosphomannomutase
MSASPSKPPCFKAYDIRGRVPEELDEELATRIGLATVRRFGGRRWVVGRDCRLSSPALAAALVEGMNRAGADVLDIGLCGTEQVYYATFARELDGGIMVTASHNPAGENGMKLVQRQSRPISGDSGLDEIGAMTLGDRLEPAATRGSTSRGEILTDYLDFLLARVDRTQLKPIKIVANAGNGCAGPVMDALAPQLPCELVRLQFEPDGSFPLGVPNPLLPENRCATASVVRDQRADLGLAWDGDFDRCFFFDERGDFIEGYYLVGLLAGTVLRDHPGAKIIHDPRLTWNTIDIVTRGGGIPIQSKTGHAFIKERMRRENAAYGGEMSAHHYFREFAFCDSGMLPWLLVWQEMSRRDRTLSALVADMQSAFPASGEINRRLSDPDAALARIEGHYAARALRAERTDGISLEFDTWRFNLRKSNTEPVVRLNVESRGDPDLMRRKTAEILSRLEPEGGG